MRTEPTSTGLDDLLTTQEVARLAGVGATAVKRWSDAGLLRTVRTVGGHRRFPRAEVDRFLRERGSARDEPGSWADQLLRTTDVRALEGLLLAERTRAGSWARVADTLGDALTELGARWASGQLSIASEHLASERLCRALARIVEAIPGDPDAPRCLLLSAEGDDHTLGLSLVQLVAHEAGWTSAWCGRSTPLSEVGPLLATGDFAMVAVSGSCASSDALAMARLARDLGELCAARGVALVLGGEAAWPERPPHGFRLRSLQAFRQLLTGDRGRLA